MAKNFKILYCEFASSLQNAGLCIGYRGFGNVLAKILV